jgi:hypothetical protein
MTRARLNSIAILLFLVTMLGTGSHSSSQDSSKHTPDMYEQVPPDRRDLLKKAVADVIEAEKQGDCGKVYDLLGDTTPKESRSEFLRECATVKRLREFVPSELDYSAADNWTVSGCASYVGDKTKLIGVYSCIVAKWRSGRWSTTPVEEIMLEKAEQKEHICKMPK